MKPKHSVKAKVAKARVAFCHEGLSGYVHAHPQKCYFSAEEKDMVFNCAVLPFATAKQAREAVRVHNMTHEERVELVAFEINKAWNPADGKRDIAEIDRKAARAVLSALHFREGTKE